MPRKRFLSAVAASALLGTLVAVVVVPRLGEGHVRRAPTRAAVAADLAHLPLAFERNVGQADGATRFLTRQPGYDLLIGANDSRMVLSRGNAARPSVLTLRTLGSNPDATVTGGSPLPGRVNYFEGRSASRWRTGIATFARVDVQRVYPGIDLTYGGGRDRIEYTFTLAARADPAAIRLGVRGASTLRVDAAGDLVLGTPAGRIVERAPVAYQTIGGRRLAVRAAFVLHGRTVRFSVSRYDRAAPLVIDPVLTYSTYLGGDNGDGQAYGVALTSGGDIVVTGSTTSPSFISTESGSYAAGLDGFVIELDPSGSSVVYSTYIGGDARDQATAVAVDPAGDAYVTGYTDSNDYPLQASPPATNDTDTTIGGNLDAFVTELNPSGNALVYSTIVGGSGTDEGEAIAVGSDGAAYITGLTSSTVGYPTTPGAYQQSAATWSAFVTKLEPAGADPERIAWSTLLGGTGASTANLGTSGEQVEQAMSEGLAVAVDGSGNVYVGGITLATGFPTAKAYSASMGQAGTSGFVAKLSSDGSTLDWSTYLGGTHIGDKSQVNGLALAGSKVVVVGATNATDFPTTAHAYQGTNGGGYSDAFATELNPSATGAAQLAYSTFLGGSDADAAEAVAATSTGDVYVTGLTYSTDFPTVSAFSGSTGNAFVSRLEPSKSGAAGLVWSSYLGGGGDAGLGVAVNGSGNVFVAGVTGSTSFPTVNPLATAPSSFGETPFLAEVAGNASSHILSVSPGSGTAGATVTITGAGFTGATAVSFGGVAGVGVTVNSDTQVTATVPALAVDGNVTVTTPGGVSNGVPFDVVPVVTGFSPTHGVAGQVVDVDGTSLVKPTALTLDGLKIPVTTVAAGTQLKFTLPTTAASGLIAVTTANGVADTSTDTPSAFTVDPSIASFSPAGGVAGTAVHIVGSGLAGATDVSFTTTTGTGWTSATPTSDTATAIVVPVPADATLGPIRVTTSSSQLTSAASFKPLPKIAALSPADGVAGGTATITGTNLLGATSVKFGTSVVTGGGITTDTATEIQATIPGAPFSSGAITVTTPAGTATSPTLFAISKLTSFTPAKALGGAVVTISGAGLGSTNEVDFAGASAPAQIVSVSATSVKADVPDDAVPGTLTVHTAAATLTTTGQFAPLPKITGYDQPSYQEGGAVTIDGTNLTAGTFKLGTVALTAGVGSDATHFNSTVPAGAVTGAVTVTTAGGAATGPKLLVRPTITSLSVTRGTTGTVLTIDGATFTGTTSARFAGSAGAAKVTAKFGIVSASQLSVTVPAAAVSGAIAVTNAGGETDSGTFTVDPAIASFSPASGAAGATVVVQGSGFGAGDQASVGTVAASSVTVVSSTEVKLVVPPGVTSGDVDVWADPAHKAQSATPFTVTFSATELEQTIAPAGSRITIDGVGLTGVTSVHFDDAGTPVAVAPASIASDGSSLTVVVPSTGTVDGVVGLYKSAASHTTVPGTFTRLTLDAPNTLAAPGDTLTLDGSGFTGAIVEFLNGWTAYSAPETPTSVNGAGTVMTVTVPGGFSGGAVQVVPASGISYLVEQPLMGLSTWSGHVGDTVTVTSETGLSIVDVVTVDGVAATVSGVTSSSLEFTITSGEDTGIVDVGGTSSTTAFDVEPEITGVSPSSGPTGTAVTLTGDHLADVTSASVDSTDVTDTISGNSASQLTITIPAGDTFGQIVVTNANGSATAAFTVTLSITGVAPGDATAGTTGIVITGFGFTGATDVSFNGTPASFTVDSDTQITATVPNSATTGPITVTAPAGTATSPSSFTVDP